MAIIFVSPRKTQRIIFVLAVILFVLILLAIAFVAVLPELRNQLSVAPAAGQFKMPDVNINFDVVDSDQVKNLEPFTNIQTEYNYVAIDASGNQSLGTISATSAEEAKNLLMANGLQVSSLQEIGVGRTDPFVSYYQQVTIKTPTAKK